MKVVATMVGYYNHILRDVGEVFSLLDYPDGTYPQAYRKVAKVVNGVPVPGQWVAEPMWVVDEDGKQLLKNGKPIPAHRDYAEDLGNLLIEEGPNAGEAVHLGWMRKVPEHVPEGLYPPNIDFWSRNVQLPVPYIRGIGQQDRRATPIATHATPPLAKVRAVG
jgi:hypothetical protein